MIDYTGVYTDFYELSMGEAYYLNGRERETAVFDYFFRKIPFAGGYAVFSGLETLLKALENLRFTQKDLQFLKGKLHPEFLDYLKSFKFRGSVYSCSEGDLIFPTRPVLQVQASLIEAQVIETLLLNILNFQSLIATKASRVRQAAPEATLVDFGMRRAQGPASYYASRACVVGGFDGTSNVKASMDFDIPVMGTMAHSFIQSFENELDAFRNFSISRPKDCVLLVDTYSTLLSGLPNAIVVGKEMRAKGTRLKGIRLDSGDLGELAKQARDWLDEAGFRDVGITASNELDEYVVKNLVEQKAPINVFGVGTRLVTGSPDGALDGVYKLACLSGKPRLKLSETLKKVSLPHKKQVYRAIDDRDSFVGAEVVTLKEEECIENMSHPFEPLKTFSLKNLKLEPLLQKVMEGGKRISSSKGLVEIRKYCEKQLSLLPAEYKRFESPAEYKIGISQELKNERDRLVKKYQRKSG